MKKLLVIGVIVLFLGLACAPSINANVEPLVNIQPHLLNNSVDTTTLTIRYYTQQGIKELEEEVPVEVAEILFNLIDSNDHNALTNTLARLELIPTTMNVEEVIELIDGTIGQKEYSQYESQLETIFNINNESEWKQNILCNIRGDAVDSYFYRPTAFLIEYGTALLVKALITILAPLGLLIYGLLFAVIWMALFENWPLHYLMPIKIAPAVFAILDDAFGRFPPANLSTTGLKGHWEIHDNRSIFIFMVGFLGIWISYKDGYQVPGCKFIGYSLYTQAKGVN
jgi:hypothetical protein